LCKNGAFVVTDETKETRRVEAFSDGVFAIAITLLVLEIKVPSHESSSEAGGLLKALGNQWPVYLAYVTSFLTVLIMWINHHNFMKLIKRTDHVFLLLNGLLLMGVSLAYFPTELLAEYIGQPDGRVAAGVYGGTFTIIAILFNLLWLYAARNNRLLDTRMDLRLANSITRRYAFGPLLYFTSFVLAFASAEVSVFICVALAIFFALPNTIKETT
jgi:uncharacterized membrane protein